MADDIERLRAALQRAEELARGATAGPWRYNPDKVWNRPGPWFGQEFVGAGPEGTSVAVCGTGPEGEQWCMANAEFIAAWSPDVVLRLVERDRQMIVAARIASEAVETLMRNWLEEDGYAPLVAAGARLNALNEGIKAALVFWCPDPTPGGGPTTQEGRPE